jgi:hypothetical protein
MNRALGLCQNNGATSTIGIMSDASDQQHPGSAECLAEHSTHLGPVDACPECGGHDFATQNRDDTVLFVCVGCNIAWRYELSYIWPVITRVAVS